MNAAIEIKNLKRFFGRNLVINGISLDIKSGEFILITGPSGSGKTTLLKLIIGLIRPNDGEVRVFGKNIFSLSGTDLNIMRQRMGMVFQASALFDFQTVKENIAFPLQHLGLAKDEIEKRVKEILTDIKLIEAANLFPIQLSGGMKKRVAIGRMMVYQPLICLYDEPTLSLDFDSARMIVELICQFHQKKEGRVSIVVTHQIELFSNMAKKVFILKDGKLFKKEGK